MKTLETLAARLSHLVDVAGLTLEEVDRLAGLSSAGHTGQIVRGRKEHPRATTALSLAAVFGVPVEWLIYGGGEAPSDFAVRRAVAASRRSLGHADNRTPLRARRQVNARAGGARAARRGAP